MPGVQRDDWDFRRLQDALLQRIVSSKIPGERERLLNMHRRLLKQKRWKHTRVMDELVNKGDLHEN